MTITGSSTSSNLEQSMKHVILLLLALGLMCQAATAQTATATKQGTIRLGSGLTIISGAVSVSGVDASALTTGTIADARLPVVLLTKSATIQATTYANAVSQCATLATGVAALVKVAADESPGNVGTGTNGTNPTTYYLFFPVIGLVQQVVYPN